MWLPLWSIRTAHHAFLESRHTEVNKNLYYILSPKGCQKKISAHGVMLVVRKSKCMKIQKFRSSAKPRIFLPLKQLQKKSEFTKFTYFTDESLPKKDKLNTKNVIKVFF